MNAFHVLLRFLFIAFFIITPASVSGEPTSIHDFSLKSIDGDDVSLASYSGKVIMIVNVASKCGLTPQYEQLQKIYEKYGDQGFVILGFPANNFAGQEPGSNEEIRQFCSLNYGVTFPMFAKISVKGDDIHPLYKYLTEKTGEYTGEISWNFTKFLIDGNGVVTSRFSPKSKPDATEVVSAIEEALEALQKK